MNMSTQYLLNILVVSTLGGLGCTTTVPIEHVPTPQEMVRNEKMVSSLGGHLIEPVKPIPGLKRSLAVAPFEFYPPVKHKYGDLEILKKGLRESLVELLEESGQFIIMEGVDFPKPVSAMLGGAGKTTKKEESTENTREPEPQFIMIVHIVEFKQFLFPDPMADCFTCDVWSRLPHRHGRVELNFRILATIPTPEIVGSGRVYEKAEEVEFNRLDGPQTKHGMAGLADSFGSDQFWKTEIGKAWQQAMNKTAHKIVKEVRNEPWQGKIIKVEGNMLGINSGARAGIQPGDQLLVKKIAKRIVVPETGELLAVKMENLGGLKITEVQTQEAIGWFTPLGDEWAKVDDIILEKP